MRVFVRSCDVIARRARHRCTIDQGGRGEENERAWVGSGHLSLPPAPIFLLVLALSHSRRPSSRRLEHPPLISFRSVFPTCVPLSAPSVKMPHWSTSGLLHCANALQAYGSSSHLAPWGTPDRSEAALGTSHVHRFPVRSLAVATPPYPIIEMAVSQLVGRPLNDHEEMTPPSRRLPGVPHRRRLVSPVSVRMSTLTSWSLLPSTAIGNEVRNIVRYLHFHAIEPFSIAVPKTYRPCQYIAGLGLLYTRRNSSRWAWLHEHPSVPLAPALGRPMAVIIGPIERSQRQRATPFFP